MSGAGDITEALAALKPPPLVYADYIAERIRRELSKSDDHNIIFHAGHVKSDLHPEGGYLVSTKKTLRVIDRNNRHYIVTVEEEKP